MPEEATSCCVKGDSSADFSLSPFLLLEHQLYANSVSPAPGHRNRVAPHIKTKFLDNTGVWHFQYIYFTKNLNKQIRITILLFCPPLEKEKGRIVEICREKSSIDKQNSTDMNPSGQGGSKMKASNGYCDIQEEHSKSGDNSDFLSSVISLLFSFKGF